MLKAQYIQATPTHGRLPARPAVYFTVSTKKRGLTATLPFWYDGCFLSAEKQPRCPTAEAAQGICLAETGIMQTESDCQSTSDWMKGVNKSEAGGQHFNRVVFISVSTNEPVFPHCGLG